MRASTPAGSPRRRGPLPMLARKLWADTRALTGQTVGLMVLIGLGVMLFVGLYEAYQNLTVIYDHIYSTTRMADASVLVRAAPPSLVDKVRTIPHVQVAMGRVVRDGEIIQRGRDRERLLGRFIGVPRDRRPAVNDLLLTEGRYLENDTEVVLEQQFAGEYNYRLGDRIKCSYLSREREFTVVGFATSPEYVYPVPSRHTVFVSRGTFGVVFVEEELARQWLGMGAQISEVHCLVTPGHAEEVVEKLEGLARPWGVEFAYTQDEQPSKHLLDLDQQGFAQLSVFFPVLFLLSAGLSLYGALARMVRLQITVIGTLRALGLTQREILGQYLFQGLLIALAGAIPGTVLGHGLAMLMNQLYAEALHLPLASAAPHWDTIFTGLALAAGTGLVAAWLPARMAARLPPAVAMRGEMESAGERRLRQALVRWTSFVRVAWRIPLRGIFRRASRTLLAVAGIAGGASIIITTLGMYLATVDALEEVLTGSRHYQIDVQFTGPQGATLARAACRLPGGRACGLTVSLPVRARSSWDSAELIVTGLQSGQQLLRVRTHDHTPMQVRPGEIWIPRRLAERLRLEPGDPIELEWVKSDRRRRLRTTMRVGGLVDVAMGNSAYAEYRDLRRSLADAAFPESSFGAHFDCDPAGVPAFRNLFERSDQVALVSTTQDLTEEVAEQMSMVFIFIGVLLSFGSVLAGSALHSVSSVSLLERTRELASLRSLGFSARATALLAGVELLALALLGLIVGLPLGAWLNRLFMSAYETETMSFRAILPPWVHLVTIAIVLALVVLSTWLGMRRLRAMDLSQATKSRE